MRPNSKVVAPFFALWTKMNNNPDTWGHEGHNQVTVLSHLEKLKDVVTFLTLCILSFKSQNLYPAFPTSTPQALGKAATIGGPRAT